MLLSLLGLGMSETCETIGFDINNTSSIKYFDGNKNLAPIGYDGLEGSLILKDATPLLSREVVTSVVVDSETPSFEFWWKINETNGVFFNLKFYIDNNLVEQCKNFNWDVVAFSDFESETNKSHMLKWVLEYNPDVPYLERSPKGSAYIDELRLCGLHFEKDKSRDFVAISQNITTPIIPVQSNGTIPYYVRPLTIFNELVYISPCNEILNNSDNLSTISEVPKGQTICLSEGDYNGMINISNLSDVVINSRILNEAQLIGNSNKCNIILYKCNNVTISGLRLIDGMIGIWLQNSSNCRILNNIITVGGGAGILLNQSSSNNIISGNNIYSLDGKGQPAIVIEDSDGNTLSCNNNYKEKGYSYILYDGNNNNIYNINRTILIGNREYKIKRDEFGVFCFFRIYPPIHGSSAIEERIAPQFTDERNNFWCCGGSQCE